MEARRIMATPKVPRPSSAEPLYAPWHFLYFFPLPQGQGSLRPTLFTSGAVAAAVAGSASEDTLPSSLGCV